MSACKPVGSQEGQPAEDTKVIELSPADLTYLSLDGEGGGKLAVSGVLTPRRQVTLKAKLAGEVVELPVQEGDALAAGALIARIDTADARALVAERRALVASAEAELQIARKQLEAQRRLLDTGFVAQSAFDVAEANFHAKQSAKLAAQAQLTLSETALSHAEVRSPSAGVVYRRHANAGEYLPIGGPLVTLMDPAALQLVVSVPATEIARVAVGGQTRLSIVGDSTVVAGRVARVSPAPDAGTRAYAVYVDVDNADGRLRIGMFARGHLHAGTSRDGAATITTLPSAAVRGEGGQHYVLTIEGGRLVRRPVKLGRHDAALSRAEVEAPFGRDVPVLLTRHERLRDGQQVALPSAPR